MALLQTRARRANPSFAAMRSQLWEQEFDDQLYMALSTGRRWAIREGDNDGTDHRAITPGDRATVRVLRLLKRAVVGHARACHAAGYKPVETLLAVRELCRPRVLPVLASERAIIGRALIDRIVTWTMHVLFPEGPQMLLRSLRRWRDDTTRPVDRVPISS
jgi:hypothetical protein